LRGDPQGALGREGKEALGEKGGANEEEGGGRASEGGADTTVGRMPSGGAIRGAGGECCRGDRKFERGKISISCRKRTGVGSPRKGKGPIRPMRGKAYIRWAEDSERGVGKDGSNRRKGAAEKGGGGKNKFPKGSARAPHVFRQ